MNAIFDLLFRGIWGFHFGGHRMAILLPGGTQLILCFPIRSFITLAEDFGKWRPYLELFGGHRGPEILLGAAALLSPFGTDPTAIRAENTCNINRIFG